MSQKYKFGRKKHRNPDSKYAFSPEQLDKDIEANAQRVERKKEHLKEMIGVEITRDPIHMEETFSVLIDVLQDVKKQYDL
ncbi:hypothetical protein ACE106_15170 [Shouchella clausii]|uniref:hypothetical protein n=1 Tax=Shouchella clausii TaxID=79880 RepID=UPI00289AB4FD|nr:hypothetical protein [Shouchella clausii]